MAHLPPKPAAHNQLRWRWCWLQRCQVAATRSCTRPDLHAKADASAHITHVLCWPHKHTMTASCMKVCCSVFSMRHAVTLRHLQHGALLGPSAVQGHSIKEANQKKKRKTHFALRPQGIQALYSFVLYMPALNGGKRTLWYAIQGFAQPPARQGKQRRQNHSQPNLHVACMAGPRLCWAPLGCVMHSGLGMP